MSVAVRQSAMVSCPLLLLPPFGTSATATDPDLLQYSHNHNRPMRFEVRYQTPYNACEWRSQWFTTKEEADRMVDFYRSCGSPSHIAPSSLAQLER